MRIERGHFEDHRLFVLWLLRQAVKLQQSKGETRSPGAQKVDAADSQKVEPPDGEHPPFYQEEIAWLLNESGTLNLVQGRLTDAIGLLQAAQAAASRIETEETGAIRTRIGLNQAVVQIERGRFPAARQRLTTIVRTEGEHPVIPLIATGYLGLIDHLTGNLGQAKRYYQVAIHGWNFDKPDEESIGLVALGRSRAASIFYRHYGDLLLLESNYKDARLAIDQAINLAREGGHEDVCHLAQLSQIRLELTEKSPADLRDVFTELNNVSAYARMVGMPRTICEVEALRAQALRSVGDLRGASAAALQGLEVSTRHDLKLRKAIAVISLAEISDLQKLDTVTAPLIEAALEIARDTNFYNAMSRAQQLQARVAEARYGAHGRPSGDQRFFLR